MNRHPSLAAATTTARAALSSATTAPRAALASAAITTARAALVCTVLVCSGLAACSSPAPPAFNPGGPASTAPATPMATSSGPGSVVMPPFGKNAHVIMTDWMPADAGMAKAVLADKDDELAFLGRAFGAEDRRVDVSEAAVAGELGAAL